MTEKELKERLEARFYPHKFNVELVYGVWFVGLTKLDYGNVYLRKKIKFSELERDFKKDVSLLDG